MLFNLMDDYAFVKHISKINDYCFKNKRLHINQKKRFFRPYTLKFDHLFAFIFADILIYLNKLNHFTLIV